MNHQFLRKTIWLLGILVVGLAIVNVLLIRQNAQMRNELSKQQPQKLEKGDVFQNFVAKDSNGNQININFSENSPKRFLLYFTPSCPYCKHQFPEWKELISQAKDKNIEVLGVMSENEDKKAIENYLNSFDCGIDSSTPLQVLFVPDETLRNYKLSLTPTTLLLSGNGIVEQSWIGKWNETDKNLALNLLND